MFMHDIKTCALCHGGATLLELVEGFWCMCQVNFWDCVTIKSEDKFGKAENGLK